MGSRESGTLEVFPPDALDSSRRRFRLNRYREDIWRVGVAQAPISSFTQPGSTIEVDWLPVPRRGFIADPFPIDSRTFIAEEYSFSTGKGELAVFDAGTGERRHTLSLTPDPGVHLSYPLVLRVDGSRYLVPEQSQSRRLDLYRLDGRVARRVCTLIADAAVADATIIHQDGHWYLFAIMADTDPLGRELHLYHSDQLEHGWEPHRCSPSREPSHRLRPAGPLFRVGTDLYRPAQDCTAGYGSAITIHRVVQLSRTAFREVPVSTVRSITPPFHDGCHTLTAIDEERTLVDLKRRLLFGAVRRGRSRQ